MSQIERGNFTPTGTGSQTYTGLSFLPDIIIFTGGQVGGSANLQSRGFFGVATSGSQRVDSHYGDGSNRTTQKETNRCILLHTAGPNVGLECEFISFYNPGGGVFGFTLDQHTNNLSTQCGFIAFQA
jgi:hypothetical protein